MKILGFAVLLQGSRLAPTCIWLQIGHRSQPVPPSVTASNSVFPLWKVHALDTHITIDRARHAHSCTRDPLALDTGRTGCVCAFGAIDGYPATRAARWFGRHQPSRSTGSVFPTVVVHHMHLARRHPSARAMPCRLFRPLCPLPGVHRP